ncbi:DUF1963 domain-containing protein [Deinococcus sedimenti]|uniref:DUF1963 domain-containing protein n=1 Tax=Deinococcus sedimenti TaxID=1867090 RepID=A0ABQ2SB00_9DEIO|nr:DUF1963 domain-containing protein [Deinococcus sedimenti]GGS07152.1 hypothetical protein GCM10008960_36990 [Deinococcus sedimenti]
MASLQTVRDQARPLLAAQHPGNEYLLPQLIRGVINLTFTPQDDATLPLGTSKVGGHPDLRPDSWPRDAGGQPMTFAAQFNLTDLQAFDEDHLLPQAGLLSFFLGERAMGGHVNAGHFEVRYEPDLTAVRRTPTPPELDVPPDAHGVAFTAGVHPFGSFGTWLDDGTRLTIPQDHLVGTPAWAAVTDAADITEDAYLLGVAAVALMFPDVTDEDVTLLTIPNAADAFPFAGPCSYAFVIAPGDLTRAAFSAARLVIDFD